MGRLPWRVCHRLGAAAVSDEGLRGSKEQEEAIAAAAGTALAH